MVYYGPWQQRPDFTRVSPTYAFNSSYGGYGQTGLVDYDMAFGETAQAMSTAQSDLILTGGGIEQVAIDVQSRGHDFSGPKPLVDHEASFQLGFAPRKPDLALPAISAAEYPEGAISYEWAASTCTPVGAAVDWDLDITETATGGMALNWSASFGFAARDWVDGTDIPPAGLPLTILAAVGGAGSAGSVDLTSYLTSGGGFVFGYTFRADLASLDPAQNGSASVAVGPATVDGIRASYTLRPPLLRWIFDAAPVRGVPPLRQFPRDDGLATSSARRQLGSQSWQGSNRRVGYW